MPGRGRGFAGRGRGRGEGAQQNPGRHTEAIKKQALDMLAGGMSFSQVGEALGGISKSTLFGWKKNPNLVLGSGNTTVLSEEEEGLIVCAFKFLSDGGLPMTTSQLLAIVQQFCASVGRPTPFAGGCTWNALAQVL